MTTLDSSTIVQPILVEELSLPKLFAEDVVVSARHDVRCCDEWRIRFGKRSGPARDHEGIPVEALWISPALGSQQITRRKR